jgi:hypothetical protein
LQVEIIINDVKIPIIKEEEVRYYPISYLGNKVLLKNLSPVQLKQNGYGEYIKEIEVNYGECIGGVQNTYCISEDGLKVILKNSKIGRLLIEQRKAMNKVLEYLGMETIVEDERFIKRLEQNKILKYPEYIQDCINDILESEPNIIWQKCGKCGNYYPYHVNFFRENPHAGHEYLLYTFCRDCKWTEGRSRDWIRRNSNELSTAYRTYGIDTYRLYKNNNVVGIYKDWIEKQYSSYLPKIISNKQGYLEIIKYLYDIGNINKDNLTLKNIMKQFKFPSLEHYVNVYEVYEYLFGDDPINYPWEYPNFHLQHIMEFKQYKKIFDNYLEIKNIKIDDMYNFNYVNICKECGLYAYTNNCMLWFVMNYYNNKYPAYKFNIISRNYWKVKDNRIQALKYLIEEDMKIPIEKIPLYLTSENLRKQSSTMRNVLRNCYDNNLWNWVNEIYPGKFIEEDFNITVIRNVFDSAEEHVIHDILVEKFDNVIYNQRNTKNTIKILGMNPDWFVFTDNGIWVIEYFGIGIETKEYNSRVEFYKKKMEKKFEKYKKLNWLGKVFLFPNDLKDNFNGLEEKLKLIS